MMAMALLHKFIALARIVNPSRPRDREIFQMGRITKLERFLAVHDAPHGDVKIVLGLTGIPIGRVQ
jgi:hypothetical protein